MEKLLEKKELKKTDIFKLCSTFDKKETIKCLVFLTEFTSASKKCRSLYEEILKCYKKSKNDWSKVNDSIFEINKKLFGFKEDNSTTRALRSELYKNLKLYCEFLETKRQRKIKTINTYFLDYLANRKADELFPKEYNKAEKTLQAEIGTHCLEQNYQSNKAFLDLLLKDQSKKNKLDYIQHYQKFSDYSILQKIQNYCLVLNHLSIEKQEVHSEIESEIALLLKKAKATPSIQNITEIYETAILMIKDDRFHYSKLKEILLNEEYDISRKDKRFLYALMYNFCIRNNDPYLINEARINHLKQFDEGFLHDGEYIILMNAKALCTTILNLTRSSDEKIRMTKVEAELKIKEVIEEMPPKHRETTEFFHLAILDYYFEDYELACDKLKENPKYANAFFDFDARMVLQRCYYLLDDIDEFDKGIKNFQSALRNDRDLSQKHKKGYLNFTIAIQILQNAKLVFDKNDKKKLLEKLEVFLQKEPAKVLNWFNTQIQALR